MQHFNLDENKYAKITFITCVCYSQCVYVCVCVCVCVLYEAFSLSHTHSFYTTYNTPDKRNKLNIQVNEISDIGKLSVVP